ncbi:MAG: hypothetical protein HY908_20415 [Myxococcales bacterium]|nr:hypothetical protein [Myxococcales bacterium]
MASVLMSGCTETESSATGSGGSGGATTSSTTTSGCAATVGNGDAACETCAQASCCAELVAMSASPNDPAAYDALLGCVRTGCAGGACFYPICDATTGVGGADQAIGFFFFQSCADYMGTTCCTEVKACAADTACRACLLDGDASACAASALDEPVALCQDACPP